MLDMHDSLTLVNYDKLSKPLPTFDAHARLHALGLLADDVTPSDDKPKPKRGRPKKPKHPFPTERFDEIVEALAAMSRAEFARAKQQARDIAREVSLSASAWAAYIAILDAVHLSHGSPEISINRIAKASGLIRQTAVRAIKALSDAGLLARRERRGKNDSLRSAICIVPVMVTTDHLDLPAPTLGADNSDTLA